MIIPTHPWLSALKVYTHPRVLGMLFLGFSAGLPFLLVLGTLSFWLREAGVDRATIGHMSWVGLAYGIKWLWSPLVDRLPLPLLTARLGRRRSWLLVSQIVIAGSLLGMANTDPVLNLSHTIFLPWPWPSPLPPRTLPWMPIGSRRWKWKNRVPWRQAIRQVIASP